MVFYLEFQRHTSASYSHNDIYLKNKLKLIRKVNISQNATKYISKRIDPRSRLSCGVTRTILGQHFADLTTSCSYRRMKELGHGDGQLQKSCLSGHRGNGLYVDPSFVRCCSAEKGLRQNYDMLKVRRRGYGMSHMHVDDQTQMLAAERGCCQNVPW